MSSESIGDTWSNGSERRSRRRTMKNNLRAAALVVLASLAFSGCSKEADEHAGHAPAPAEKKTLYQCPMHPQIIQNRPGDCPICNMRLVPVEGTPSPAEDPERRGSAATHVPVTITPE